jgi:hypothetical protein
MSWSHEDSQAVELFWEAVQRLLVDPKMKRLGFGCSSEYSIRHHWCAAKCRFDAWMWTGVYPPENRVPLSSTSFVEIHGKQHFRDVYVIQLDRGKARFLCEMERPLWVLSDFEVHALARRQRLLSSIREFALGKQRERKVLYDRDGSPTYFYGNSVCYYSAAGSLITLRSRGDIDWFHERWEAPSTDKENPYYRILGG